MALGFADPRRSYTRAFAEYVLELSRLWPQQHSVLAPACAPLVCIEGQPKTAARLLLGQLMAAKVGLLDHGDFDWDGVRSANLVMKRHEASPWRLSSDCYHAISGARPSTGTPCRRAGMQGL